MRLHAPDAAGPALRADGATSTTRPGGGRRTGLGPKCAGRGPALHGARTRHRTIVLVQRASRADGCGPTAEIRRPPSSLTVLLGRRPVERYSLERPPPCHGI
ncbi:hypothetical protein E4P36_10060 [Streptomyces sp. 4R-3d]|nr:hypothetical protein E4P36_10060 [Streptomyces sp. 4R-3d]